MIRGGRLGDLYGRRRLFIIGLVLFTLTSAACGLAPSAGFLVTARVLQGAAGAMMTPQVLAILSTVYAGTRRGRAFAAYGLAMGIAGVLGQLLGGALIQADIGGSGWRSIFLLNVPVGILALLLAWAATGSSSAGLLPGLAVTGFGIGMVLVPLSSAVMRDVDPQRVGAASGVLSTAQQVGGALGWPWSAWCSTTPWRPAPSRARSGSACTCWPG
jgi:MFS family permease